MHKWLLNEVFVFEPMCNFTCVSCTILFVRVMQLNKEFIGMYTPVHLDNHCSLFPLSAAPKSRQYPLPTPLSCEQFSLPRSLPLPVGGTWSPLLHYCEHRRCLR